MMQTQRILKLQKWFIRIILNKRKLDSCRTLFPYLKILTFPALFIYKSIIYIHELALKHKISLNSNIHSHNTRTQNRIFISQSDKPQLFADAIKFYNHIPSEFRSMLNLSQFKKCVRSFLTDKALYSFKEFFENNLSCTSTL